MGFGKKNLASSQQYPHLAAMQRSALKAGMSYHKVGKLSSPAPTPTPVKPLTMPASNAFAPPRLIGSGF